MLDVSSFVFLGIIAIAAALLVLAAISDVRKYRIPNLACLGLVILFPIAAVTSPLDVMWCQHIAVFLAVLVVGFVLFARKLVTAGDVKLFAAVSLWAGWSMLGELVIVTAVTGGLLALSLWELQRRRARALDTGVVLADDNKPALASTPGNVPAVQHKIVVPYGVATAAGGVYVLVILVVSLFG